MILWWRASLKLRVPSPKTNQQPSAKCLPPGTRDRLVHGGVSERIVQLSESLRTGRHLGLCCKAAATLCHSQVKGVT